MSILNFRARTAVLWCGLMLTGELLLALGGCAAVVPVAGNVAGPALEQTGQLLGRGKVESFQMVPIDTAIAAVRQAADEMALKHIGEEKHPDQIKLTYADGRGQQIVVSVVRRTSTVSAIHVAVGIFGPEGLAQLMVRQILQDLPAQGKSEKNTVK